MSIDKVIFEGNGLTVTNPSGDGHSYVVTESTGDGIVGPFITTVDFQKGTVPEKGVNGLTIEALIGISIHRLNFFQQGNYPCDFNANAIEALEEALLHLNARTRNREIRGVKGKYEK